MQPFVRLSSLHVLPPSVTFGSQMLLDGRFHIHDPSWIPFLQSSLEPLEK